MGQGTVFLGDNDVVVDARRLKQLEARERELLEQIDQSAKVMVQQAAEILELKKQLEAKPKAKSK